MLNLTHILQGTDYGKPYDIDPNGVGLCKKSLATANSYVTSTSTNPNEGLAIDVKNTIDDIFRNIAGAGQELFSLYLTGYAHFFNVDPETDFCNGWSFAPFFVVKNIPLLTLDLRTTFNDYVENFNNVYVSRTFSSIPPQFSILRKGFLAGTQRLGALLGRAND